RVKLSVELGLIRARSRLRAKRAAREQRAEHGEQENERPNVARMQACARYAMRAPHSRSHPQSILFTSLAPAALRRLLAARTALVSSNVLERLRTSSNVFDPRLGSALSHSL